MARCVIGHRGKASVEWYKNGVPQYYCYGYIDSATDEPLKECQKCSDYVDNAQNDMDAWNGRSYERNND